MHLSHNAHFLFTQPLLPIYGSLAFVWRGKPGDFEAHPIILFLWSLLVRRLVANIKDSWLCFNCNPFATLAIILHLTRERSSFCVWHFLGILARYFFVVIEHKTGLFGAYYMHVYTQRNLLYDAECQEK